MQYRVHDPVLHNEVKALTNISRFIRGHEEGQVTVEWTLLMVAFGIPMIYVFGLMLSVLVGHYRMISCVLSLPFP